jgi:hypothetical protein
MGTAGERGDSENIWREMMWCGVENEEYEVRGGGGGSLGQRPAAAYPACGSPSLASPALPSFPASRFLPLTPSLSHATDLLLFF